MPTYDYICPTCHGLDTKTTAIRDRGELPTCSACGQRMRRAYTRPPGLVRRAIDKAQGMDSQVVSGDLVGGVGIRVGAGMHGSVFGSTVVGPVFAEVADGGSLDVRSCWHHQE